MGNQPVDARLETLPDNKIRPSAFAVSSSVQVMLALALPLLISRIVCTTELPALIAPKLTLLGWAEICA